MALKRGSTTASSPSKKKKMRMELNDDSKKPQLGLGFLGTKRVILLPPTDIIAGDCHRTPPPLLRSLDHSVPLTTTTTTTWEATIKNPSFSGGEDEEFSDADSESTAVRSAPVPLPLATATTTTTTIKKPSLLLGGEEDEESPALLKALAEEIKMEMKMMELEGHLRSMEAEPMMRPHHIMTRRGAFVRAIAINRMAQVAQRCCSRPEEILPLSVSYFDSDALFLDYLCPFATDNKYTTEDVIKVESKVLDALNFQLGEPTAKTFLDGFIFSAAAASHLDNDDNDDELLLHLEKLANYLVQLSLLEYNCVQFLPSLIAASAVFLSRFTIHPNKQPWCPVMEHRTGYTAPELKECVRIMHNLQLGRTDLRQFASLAHKYETVAIWFAPPLEIPEAYLQRHGGDWRR